MNFSSLFKSISNLTSPYSIESNPIHETPLWQVYDATRKSDMLPVTVFKANASSQYSQFIRNAVHKAKVLRLPGLCTVVEVLDSDPQNTLIITERVAPFPWDTFQYSVSKNKYGVQLIIAQILETLALLDGFTLGVLHRESVYVNVKGQCVLFGLELCYKRDDRPSDYEYQSMLTNYAELMQMSEHATDLRLLDSSQMANLTTTLMGDRIPRDWKPLVDSLKLGKITPKAFHSKLKATSAWRNNPLIELFNDMKELHIKNNHEKLEIITKFENIFWDREEIFSNLLPGFVVEFIIPELYETLQLVLKSFTSPQLTGIELTSTVKYVSLFSIFLRLVVEYNYYNDIFKQAIIQNFKLPDKQVRFLLLLFLPKFLNVADENAAFMKDLISSVFSYLVQGLSNSETSIRMETLKLVPLLVSFVTERQLNNEILRYMAKTLVDPEVEIRVRTVLIITQISNKISPTSSNERSNILATVFTKALKDPKLITRMAALYGLSECIQLFDVSTIANKILTVIAPGIIDKNKRVRSKAKELFDLYLTKLETEAARVQVESNEDENIPLAFEDFDKYGDDHGEIYKGFMENLKISTGGAFLSTSSDMFSDDKNDEIHEGYEKEGHHSVWSSNDKVLSKSQLIGKPAELDDGWGNDSEWDSNDNASTSLASSMSSLVDLKTTRSSVLSSAKSLSSVRPNMSLRSSGNTPGTERKLDPKTVKPETLLPKKEVDEVEDGWDEDW